MAITVDSDVHAEVIRAARENHMSVSAWLTDAARSALKIREGLAAVAEWERENGAFTEEERAAARERIRRSHGKQPRRKPARAK